MIALIVVLYIAFGVLNWGLTLGYFTDRFPYFPNCIVAFMMAASGFFATPAILIVNYVTFKSFHWKVKPYTKEERWEIFQQQGLGLLGRDYFDKHH